MRSYLALAAAIFLVLACSSDGGGPVTGDARRPADSTLTFRDGKPAKDAPAKDGLTTARDGTGSESAGSDGKGDDAPSVGALPPSGVGLYVNLGDSLAAGYYASAGNSYKALLFANNALLYPAYAGKDLASRYPGIKLTDKSKSGATSKDVVGQAQGVAANPFGHNLVVISAGGNDFNDNIWTMVDTVKADAAAAAAVKNLKKVANIFRDKGRFPGGATIALLTVHDPTDGRGTIPPQSGLTGFCKTLLGPAGILVGPLAIANLARFNQALVTFAQQNGLVLIRNHDGFLGHGYHHADPTLPRYDAADPTLWFHNDCAHLNNRGHHEVRRLLWQALVGG